MRCVSMIIQYSKIVEFFRLSKILQDNGLWIVEIVAKWSDEIEAQIQKNNEFFCQDRKSGRSLYLFRVLVENESFRLTLMA